tara:strand:- start:692 stop:853 length:162 start_codon:yes stop_codon:yes gene_type:complete
MEEIQFSKCWKSPDASASTSGGDDPTLGEAVMDLYQRHGEIWHRGSGSTIAKR